MCTILYIPALTFCDAIAQFLWWKMNTRYATMIILLPHIRYVYMPDYVIRSYVYSIIIIYLSSLPPSLPTHSLYIPEWSSSSRLHSSESGRAWAQCTQQLQRADPECRELGVPRQGMFSVSVKIRCRVVTLTGDSYQGLFRNWTQSTVYLQTLKVPSSIILTSPSTKVILDWLLYAILVYIILYMYPRHCSITDGLLHYWLTVGLESSFQAADRERIIINERKDTIECNVVVGKWTALWLPMYTNHTSYMCIYTFIVRAYVLCMWAETLYCTILLCLPVQCPISRMAESTRRWMVYEVACICMVEKIGYSLIVMKFKDKQLRFIWWSL